MIKVKKILRHLKTCRIVGNSAASRVLYGGDETAYQVVRNDGEPQALRWSLLKDGEIEPSFEGSQKSECLNWLASQWAK